MQYAWNSCLFLMSPGLFVLSLMWSLQVPSLELIKKKDFLLTSVLIFVFSHHTQSSLPSFSHC